MSDIHSQRDGGADQGPELPPLVAPGPELSPEQIERYRRQITLRQIGIDGQRRICAARVLVVGAGGLGTPALQYLAGAGVGAITVIDDDPVDLSNLHRQVIHRHDSLGLPKVESAAAAVTGLNPEVQVTAVRERVTRDNVTALVASHDLVIDGTDNFPSRYLIADASEITGVPVVWGAVLRSHGQVSVFWPGRGPHYRDVFPEPPPADAAPSCAEAGVLGTLPGLLGTIMASQAIQIITGTGSPLVGSLLLWDADHSSSHTLRIVRDPDRLPATEVADPAPTDLASQIGAPTPQETINVVQLRELQASGVTVIDIREPWEIAAGKIPGANEVVLDELLDRGAAALPAGVGGGEVVLYCEAGSRSAKALERLRPAWSGREGRLRHLGGGYRSWREQADSQV